MDKHFPVSQFDAIYLIDLCEPLLEVARKRFARKGWRNIHLLCQDATEFSLPEWSTTDPKGSVSFITLSYSLSMVSPSHFTTPTTSTHSTARCQTFMRCSIASTTSSVQTRACSVSSTFTPRDVNHRSMRKPLAGRARSVVGSVVGSGKSGSTLITCHCHRIDATTSSTSLARYVYHVFHFQRCLTSFVRSRRTMEGTISSFRSSYACKRSIIHVRLAVLTFHSSPYYIWVGRSRSCDVSRFCHAFEVESGNLIGNCSPASLSVIKDSKTIPLLDIGKPILEVEQPVPAHSTINITPPLSSFHYQVGRVRNLCSWIVSSLNGMLF